MVTLRMRALRLGVLIGIAASCSTGAALAQEFQYSGDDGPAHWSGLDAAWGACAGGDSFVRQSPIDLVSASVDGKLERLDLRTFATSIDIFNNGHTIEQRYEGTGSSIYFEGTEYELKQFHFHTFSEHTVAGEHGVMEMHGVFSDGSSNAVVGLLFEIGGDVNPFIQSLIDAGLPETSGDETQDPALIDFSDALTDTRSYYTYSGSLTTPPCSETVTWIVLSRRASLTSNQYESFRTILGNNFRPLQEPNERVIRVTNPAYGFGRH